MRRHGPRFQAVLAMAALAIVAWQPRAGAGPVPPDQRAAPAGAPSFTEQAVVDFYRGKTVRFIVGAPAGGAFDIHVHHTP